MSRRGTVAVVGAGIAGLAHAWSAAERGFQVTLFERADRASGASIRNFGMVWPIGQPAGPSLATALRSRDRWLAFAADAGVWVHRCGSIHLAHREDEWTVLQQFQQQSADLGYRCQLWNALEVTARTPAANPHGLIGGLFSETELCVNPRKAVGSAPEWLTRRFGVEFRFRTTVTHIDDQRTVVTAQGIAGRYDRIVICSGADLDSLFPHALADSGLKPCKLQMLKVGAPHDGWKLGPHLASGLTLRHYRNFEICPALTTLRQRIAAETPELDRYGIHVMASQNDAGELILGDSHEYGSDIEPFDKSVIDDLMLRELQRVFAFPNWTITERWHGVYAKRSDGPVWLAEPIPHVHLCTGFGGTGMTMAFGVADDLWTQWAQT
jgi:D-hydroxyproline dehydrogenase subunit beta